MYLYLRSQPPEDNLWPLGEPRAAVGNRLLQLIVKKPVKRVKNLECTCKACESQWFSGSGFNIFQEAKFIPVICLDLAANGLHCSVCIAHEFTKRGVRR